MFASVLLALLFAGAMEELFAAAAGKITAGILFEASTQFDGHERAVVSHL